MYVRELATKRYKRPPPIISGPEDIQRLLKRMALFKREHFVAVLLSARHEVLGVETISIGSLNASIVHPREVFLPAIRSHASSIIVAHNHPSGDPEPSQEDEGITHRLVDAGNLLGIAVLDSVIIAERGFVSLKARNTLRGQS